jgi:hypothetical protein
MRRCTSARPRPARGCARACKWAWLPQQKTARESVHGKHTPRAAAAALTGQNAGQGAARVPQSADGGMGMGPIARWRQEGPTGTAVEFC